MKDNPGELSDLSISNHKQMWLFIIYDERISIAGEKGKELG